MLNSLQVIAFMLGAIVLIASSGTVAKAQAIGEPVALLDQYSTINTQPGTKTDARIATLAPSAAVPGGGFVAVWAGAGPGDDTGVFMRRYLTDGTPLDPTEIRVNLDTDAIQRRAAVATRPNGTFVVVWEKTLFTGIHTGARLFFRRFRANGTALDANDVPVATAGATITQTQAALASFPDNKFVIIWSEPNQTTIGHPIRGQLFHANGAKNGSPFEVSAASTANHSRWSPKVAADGSGFVATWESSGAQDGNLNGIVMRRFASNATPLDAGDIIVNSTTTGTQEKPTIAMLPNSPSLPGGGFVIAWSGVISGFTEGAAMQRFSRNGTFLGGETPLAADPNGTENRPEVVFLPPTSGATEGTIGAVWNLVNPFFSRFAEFTLTGNRIRTADLGTATTTGGTPAALASVAPGSLVWMRNWSTGFGLLFDLYRHAGPPVARDDTATTTSRTRVSIPVLANDADADVGDSLTIVFAEATQGGVAISGGSLEYDPPTKCAITSDVIDYTIEDSQGNTAKAKVTVTITPAPIMSVSPATIGRLYGPVGGPFPAPYVSYLVSNSGCANLDWTVGRSQTWLLRTPATGTLAVGANQLVELRANANANGLPAGVHNDLARFRNTVNGLGNGNRTIQLNTIADFAHNNFGLAPVLMGSSGTTWGSNVTATGQPDEPNHAGVSLPLASVWWQWTAPADGTAVFHTGGSGFDTTLAVYTGTTIPNLSLVASNDDHGPIAPASRVSFNAVAGTTYRIAVDGKAAETGLIKLTWVMP